MSFTQESVELLLSLRRIGLAHQALEQSNSTTFPPAARTTLALLKFLSSSTFVRWSRVQTVAWNTEAALEGRRIYLSTGSTGNYLGCLDEEGGLYLQIPSDFLLETEPSLSGQYPSVESALLIRLIQLVPALFCLEYLQEHLSAHLARKDPLEPLATAALRHGLQQQIQFLSVLHDLFPREVFLEVMSSAKQLLLTLN